MNIIDNEIIKFKKIYKKIRNYQEIIEPFLNYKCPIDEIVALNITFNTLVPNFIDNFIDEIKKTNQVLDLDFIKIKDKIEDYFLSNYELIEKIAEAVEIKKKLDNIICFYGKLETINYYLIQLYERKLVLLHQNSEKVETYNSSDSDDIIDKI